VKERIALAYDLCRGRFLEDPRFLISTELLNIPAQEVILPRFAPTLRKYMDLARRANSFDELVSSGVRYKGRKARINSTWIQLLHLALDRFVIVTGDPDLTTRTARSPQANRIMSFQQFTRTAATHPRA
jgi:hypothetical protein